MDAEKIAELKRLHADMPGKQLTVELHPDDGFSVIDDRGMCLATTSLLSEARCVAALLNAFPDLIAALEAAETRAEKAESNAVSALSDALECAMESEQIEAERDALRARVERLREVMESCVGRLDGIPDETGNVVDCVSQLEATLAATPAQSLAKVRAEPRTPE